MALSVMMAAGVTTITAGSAGAWGLTQSSLNTVNNACRYNYDGYYRTNGITLAGNLITTTNPAPVPGEVITLPAGSVTASAEIADSLVESAYQLNLLQLGENQVPVQVWMNITGVSTARGDGPVVVSPASQLVKVDGFATTTLTADAGGVSATPLAATLPLPETTWTALGGQVQFVQAKTGSIEPILVNGTPVDPEGTVFIEASLGSASMTLDCQPYRIPLPAGDGLVEETNACIGNLAGYAASGGATGHSRELSNIDIQLDGRAVSSGSTVRLSDTDLQILIPGDMLLQMYRQQYGGHGGKNGFIDPGATYKAWAWVAIEGRNTVEGVQKVHAEFEWTPSTVVDPTPGQHPSQGSGTDPNSRLTGRNSGDESATAQPVTVTLPDTTWTATGDGEVTFHQGAPGTLGRVEGIQSLGYVDAEVNPAEPTYALDTYGSVLFRTWTKAYGANLDCRPGRDSIRITDYTVAWPGGGRAAPQAPAARYTFAAATAAPAFATATGDGYRLVASDGGIFTFGAATFEGTVTSTTSPVVGAAGTPSGEGYWLVTAAGTVSAFGDAEAYGSVTNPNKPIVGIAATPSGEGYWLVATDGGIFAFGDAEFYGSTGAVPLNKPIVGISSTPSGEGYWLVASDGGIFAFGDAAFYGSTGAITLNKPIVGIATTPSGEGYWLVATDGGIFSFGDAGFYGSTGAIPLNMPIVGMASSPSGEGYRMVASDGGIFTFGDTTFLGSTGDVRLNQPIIGFMPMF